MCIMAPIPVERPKRGNHPMHLWELITAHPLPAAFIGTVIIVVTIAVVSRFKSSDDYEATKNEDGLWGSTHEE